MAAQFPLEVVFAIARVASSATRRNLRAASYALCDLLTPLAFHRLELHLKDGAPHRRLSALMKRQELSRVLGLIKVCTLECNPDSLHAWHPASVVDGLRALHCIPQLDTLELSVHGLDHAPSETSYAFSALIMRLSSHLSSLPFSHIQTLDADCGCLFFSCGLTATILDLWTEAMSEYNPLPKWACLCPLHLASVTLRRVVLDRISFRGIYRIISALRYLCVDDVLIELGSDASTAPRWSMLWEHATRAGEMLELVNAQDCMYGRSEGKWAIRKMEETEADELKQILEEDRRTLNALQSRLDRDQTHPSWRNVRDGDYGT